MERWGWRDRGRDGDGGMNGEMGDGGMNGGIEGGRHRGMNGEMEGWKDRGRGGGMEGEMEKWRERWRDGGMEGWKEGWMKGWMARQMFAVALSPQGAGRLEIPVQTPLTPVARSGPANSSRGTVGTVSPAPASRGAAGTQGRVLHPRCRWGSPTQATAGGGTCSWWMPHWCLPPAISHFPHPVPPVRGPSFTTAAQTGGNWLGGMFNPVSSAFPSHSSTPAAGPARPAAPAGPWGG